jgi:hypothetical protein
MTRVRIALVAAVATLALGGAVISDAVAAPGSHGSSNVQSVPPLFKVHVNGKSKNGKKFSGTYGVQRFVVATVHGKRGVYALGVLTGRLGGRHVSRNNVLLPASLSHGGSTTRADRTPRQASCTILHLVLGPINLNLLGLQVTLAGANGEPVVLDITAHQGQGLLGDLLCDIDNALSGSALSGLLNNLQQLVGVLNQIAGVLSGL